MVKLLEKSKIVKYKVEGPKNQISEHFHKCTMLYGPDNKHTIVQYIRYELLLCQNTKIIARRKKWQNYLNFLIYFHKFSEFKPIV